MEMFILIKFELLLVEQAVYGVDYNEMFATAGQNAIGSCGPGKVPNKTGNASGRCQECLFECAIEDDIYMIPPKGVFETWTGGEGMQNF